MNKATELACAFPPRMGCNGAATRIEDLGWSMPHADSLFANSKKQAVRLIVAANMEMGEARGKGYKAAKRATEAFLALGRDIEAMNARILANRARWRADYIEELRTEGRIHNA